MSFRLSRIAPEMASVPGLVRYLLAMKLVDTGRARIGRVRIWGHCHYLEIIRSSGQAFLVRRPPISMELELRLRRELGALLRQGREDHSDRDSGSG